MEKIELFKSFKKFDEEDNAGFGKEPKPVIFRSIEYNIEDLCNKILDINNLDEEEIKRIILNQYSMILNYDLFLSSEQSRKCAQMLFTNETFLTILNQEVQILNLDESQIICANKLAYDYYITANNDPAISNLLLALSYQVNNSLVLKLANKIGIDNARVLAMINRSSFKMEKRVHRTNTFFMRCNLQLSVQMIVDIMCELYDHFTYNFIYTMLEGVEHNIYVSFSDNEKETYNNISKAILHILLSLTSKDITYVLTQYGYTLKMLPNNYNVIRLTLKNIKDNRLQSIIKYIEESQYNDIKLV